MSNPRHFRVTYIPAKDKPFPAHTYITPRYNQEREASAGLCSLATSAPYERKGRHAA